MTSLQKWQTINSQIILNNQWCKVRQDEVKLPNGQIINDYFINIRPDIVLILPVTQKQKIVFVRQYRHGIEDILLELPAGTFDAHKENELDAAKRELEEETGYIASQLIELATLYDNPVKDTNKIHIFIALDASPIGKQQLDVTEEIEVVLVPIQDVKQKIAMGEIVVSGTLAAIFLGLDFLENKC
ncbi:MAG: NUDIX hydrolase [Microcystaceae cyanobacterium]